MSSGRGVGRLSGLRRSRRTGRGPRYWKSYAARCLSETVKETGFVLLCSGVSHLIEKGFHVGAVYGRLDARKLCIVSIGMIGGLQFVASFLQGLAPAPMHAPIVVEAFSAHSKPETSFQVLISASGRFPSGDMLSEGSMDSRGVEPT